MNDDNEAQENLDKLDVQVIMRKFPYPWERNFIGNKMKGLSYEEKIFVGSPFLLSVYLLQSMLSGFVFRVTREVIPAALSAVSVGTVRIGT